MDRINTLYQLLKQTNADRIDACVRKGDLSPICPLPLDDKTAAELLKHAKKVAAELLTPPVLLSDYLCYVYAGTDEDLAADLHTTTASIEQYIYLGCYWHDGRVLMPLSACNEPTQVAEFVNTCLQFVSGTRAHTQEIWRKYKQYTVITGAPCLTRRAFSAQLRDELLAAGAVGKPSLRVGDKVASGYCGVTIC